MNHPNLLPLTFTPLPLGKVRPLGWLQNQLRLQADGISGHLDEFWPDVQHSQWLGGDREAWERAPYWLDGLIPLAYVLDDPTLKAKVIKYMDFILNHQHPDGWLGPREMIQVGGRAADQNYDLWAQMLAMKVLVQYHQASGDERALKGLLRALQMLDQHLDRQPLFNWGQFRWFETLVSLYYAYDHTQGAWLIDLAVKLHAQGFDWASFFSGWPMTQPTPHGRWNYMSHVVNNAMAVKAHGLWLRLSADARDRGAVYDILDKLDRYHGTAVGIFTGDECLAGLQPTQGTELCAVVEFMYSLENLLAILGDPAFGDRLEKITFNALPATFSPDMWSHQYDQQVNQVECSIKANRTWNTNGPEANIFGVEPNYGCCTANLSQGWPKFAAHLWMESPDGGLVATSYAPSQVSTMLQGVAVNVRLDTEYPFRDKLCFSVQTEQAVNFPLILRIPKWAAGANLQIEGETNVLYPQPGTFFHLERTWQSGTQLTLNLPMTPEIIKRPTGNISIERGPLVFALAIGEDWQRVHVDQPYRQLPHADWEIYPTTPWNYALQVSPESLTEQVHFSESPLGNLPFSPQGAPVKAQALGRPVPGWELLNGSTTPAPPSPVQSQGALETLTLIPYGCTNLRLTEFPTLLASF